jgi:hypothetical protein
MPEHPVARVVVGIDFGPRSGMWRFWSHHDDLYLHHDYMRKSAKTSLHASGLCRHAFHGPAAERYRSGQDRAFLKWQPDDFAAGAKQLLEIVIPTDDLTVPAVEPSDSEKKRITLLDPALPGQITVLTVALTAPDLDVDGFPRAPGPCTLLADWALPTRGKVWIVGSHQPSDFDELIHRALPEIREQVTRQPELTEHPRLVLWTSSGEGGISRYIELDGRRAWATDAAPYTGTTGGG